MKRNRKGWPEIREQLARRGSAVPQTDARQFWEASGPPPHLPSTRRACKPARTLALGHRQPGRHSLLAAAVWFFPAACPRAGHATIHSYEIAPEHGTVMILQDETMPQSYG